MNKKEIEYFSGLDRSRNQFIKLLGRKLTKPEDHQFTVMKPGTSFKIEKIKVSLRKNSISLFSFAHEK